MSIGQKIDNLDPTWTRSGAWNLIGDGTRTGVGAWSWTGAEDEPLNFLLCVFDI